MLHLRMIGLLLFLAMGEAYAQVPGNPVIDSMEGQLQKTLPDTSRVLLMVALSGKYAVVNPRTGIHYAFEARKLAEDVKFERGISESYNKIGVNYQCLSLLDSAEEFFLDALAINERINHKKGIAQNLNNLGLNNYFRSDYPKALDYMFRSLKTYEEMNDEDGIATSFGNIGSVHQSRGDYANALKYDTLSLNKYLKLGSKENAALQLGNIGSLYESQGLFDQAIKYTQAAVNIFDETGNKTGLARNLNNLGNLFKAKNNYAGALKCLNRALLIQKEIDDQADMALTNINLGALFLQRALDTTNPPPVAGIPTDKQACLQLGISHTREGIRISEKTGNLHSLSYAYNSLTEMYTAQKDFKNALQALQTYHKLSDSLFTIDNNVRISELETERALAVKDKQIELDKLAVLKKRNERVYFLSGIALLAGLVGLMFRNYHLLKRFNIQLSGEKRKVEEQSLELDKSNKELSKAMQHLRDTQDQLIESEKQKENEIIRSRISQDIHDDISSELTRISWVSELAKAKASKSDFNELPVLLNKITDSSRETVSKLGEIIWTVNPKNDSLSSLLAYMHTYVAQFFADTPIEFEVDFPNEGTDISINPELKRNLFLVMKESLNNVLKYADASNVRVGFELKGSRYKLCIQDNGKGIEEGVVKGGGNGLRNMKRRMEDAKGECLISSGSGLGTEVCCSGEIY